MIKLEARIRTILTTCVGGFFLLGCVTDSMSVQDKIEAKIPCPDGTIDEETYYFGWFNASYGLVLIGNEAQIEDNSARHYETGETYSDEVCGTKAELFTVVDKPNYERGVDIIIHDVETYLNKESSRPSDIRAVTPPNNLSSTIDISGKDTYNKEESIEVLIDQFRKMTEE